MKSKNSFSKHLIVIAGLTAFSLFSYIYILEEVKAHSRIRIRKEEELVGKRDKLEAKLVEVQQLSSEERIVKIAEDSLGLIRSLKPFEVISVNESQVKQIKEIVDKNYE
ncbi:hypothetical protein ACFLTH_07865 [Bacteroidota bacterium]